MVFFAAFVVDWNFSGTTQQSIDEVTSVGRVLDVLSSDQQTARCPSSVRVPEDLAGAAVDVIDREVKLHLRSSCW